MTKNKRNLMLLGLGILIVSGIVIVVIFLIIPPPEAPPPEAPTSEIEIDATGTVYYIVDGDTYDQNGISGGDRVRLADIDCPESYEAGYQEAKDYLYLLIYDEFVYLDIDDINGTGPYGRWIGIVYVRYNSTHVLNVNYALLVGGYAIIDDYYNEFNPYNWKLYYYHK